MPTASDLLFKNHCGRAAVAGMYRYPIPKPKPIPWVKNRCHTLLAKEALNSDAKTNNVPIQRLGLVPKRRIDQETAGEIIRDPEMERPPIKAY